MLINSIIYLFEMSHLYRNVVMRGVIYAEELRVQFVAVVEKNSETEYPKGLLTL